MQDNCNWVLKNNEGIKDDQKSQGRASSLCSDSQGKSELGSWQEQGASGVWCVHHSHMLLSSARLFTSIIAVPDIRGEWVPSSSHGAWGWAPCIQSNLLSSGRALTVIPLLSSAWWPLGRCWLLYRRRVGKPSAEGTGLGMIMVEFTSWFIQLPVYTDH